MGGVRTVRDVDVPPNVLFDWTVINEARELATYDLVGADTPRINRYTAKFNPAVNQYGSAECVSWGYGHSHTSTSTA